MLVYPNIDPVLLQIGPLAIRWYSLAYIFGLLIGWFYFGWLNIKSRAITNEQHENLLTWALFGVVLGGRLGYVIFYNPNYYLNYPIKAFFLWEGGMSFHGGMLGVILAVHMFTRAHGVGFFSVMDKVAAATPIGLFLGRLANFINGELYGRATDVPWAMVFPTDPQALPRHPSQLYEAGAEGILLFLVLWAFARVEKYRERTGFLSGVFLAGYGISRYFIEFVREPDSQLGLIGGMASMGQILSLPMVLLGAALIYSSSRK